MAHWIITKDTISNGMHNGTKSECCPSEKEMRKTGTFFKMYDDDGELYYEGYSSCDSSFDPLDDFGMPNAGCTEIKYRNKKTRKMETL